MTFILASHQYDRSHPVLITGGCGFIGCNIADALASRGQDVLILDNLARGGSRENAAWLRARHANRVMIEEADIRDEAAVNRLVPRASAVLHLAAQVAVTTSLDAPLEDFDVNARGTLLLLEAIRRRGSKTPLIFASTNKVYGKLFERERMHREDERYFPYAEEFEAGVDENVPLDLYSPYGCSKGAADQYVHDYARVFGIPTAVLRMSCIYGPRQFGTEDQGWIAHFMISAIRGEPITIYGDGYQVRDALYIDDAVAAWLGVLDHIGRLSGSTFNLGGGPSNAVSLHEMMTLIGILQGRDLKLHYEDWRPGDQPWYVSDVRAISEAIGWVPKTPIQEGTARLYQWLAGQLGAQTPRRLEERQA